MQNKKQCSFINSVPPESDEHRVTQLTAKTKLPIKLLKHLCSTQPCMGTKETRQSGEGSTFQERYDWCTHTWKWLQSIDTETALIHKFQNSRVSDADWHLLSLVIVLRWKPWCLRSIFPLCRHTKQATEDKHPHEHFGTARTIEISHKFVNSRYCQDNRKV